MHQFANFKSFSYGQLELFHPVTLIIGRNGAGKTNALEAVELLAQLAAGIPLFEISDLGRGGRAYEVRGGLTGCIKVGSDKFTLGFSGSILFDGSHHEFQYRISVSSGTELRICDESLTIGERVIFSAGSSQNPEILEVSYDNFARGGRKPLTTLSSDRSVLSRYTSFASFSEAANAQRKNDAFGAVAGIKQYLNSAFVFDPSARAMRNYEAMGQSQLRRDGSNLSSVLHYLSKGQFVEEGLLERILSRLKTVPEEPFIAFRFIETAQRDVLVALERPDGAVIDARLMSDGTLRALAILAALETVPAGSRIILEELDNGVHPSRVHLLIDAIWEASERRKLNIVATTHNPAALNKLDARKLASVVVSRFNADENSTELVPLPRLPRIAPILANGRLGDAVTTGDLEKHFTPGFDEQQRAAALGWLEQL